ncbi:hypothetical protein C2S52_001604 [Perilla frutescens var. hirtella]|nr:hypothetical protein C2S52_001604 [Perilla frutescens var. hirtella]
MILIRSSISYSCLLNFYNNYLLPQSQPVDMDPDDLGIQRRQKNISEETTRSFPAVCLDYSILSFRKPLPVIQFLEEYLPGFKGINDVKRLRNEINTALQGLRVVTIFCDQRRTITELTREDAIDIYFELLDREGLGNNAAPRQTSLLDYYKDKWNKEILHPEIPCLELGTPQRSNKVPMEFCVLVEKQRYIPKEGLDKNSALFLRKLAVVCDMAKDGPLGHLTLTTFPRFNYAFMCLQIYKCSGVEITKVVGQAMDAPPPLPPPPPVKNRLPAEKTIGRWAVVDFTHGDCYNYKLPMDAIVNSLSACCKNLGIEMGEPLVYRFSRMHESSFVDGVEDFLKSIVEESVTRNKGKLEMIVCLMMNEKRSLENKYLKWVSETRIGVPTQCLSAPLVLNKGINHYLECVCLKIKAKLRSSITYDLTGRQWQYLDAADDDVMFIGAYVNEKASRPSIAAVVGTVNWPAANRYAARVCPQANGSETINNFGAMCKELITAYARLNNLVKPRRIVVFRNGSVSEGKLEMVVSGELLDLKKSIHAGGNYRPSITVIATQRQHPTLYLVDAASTTTRVNPVEYGAGSPTHYNVLWDENLFASDELLKLVHHMCFLCNSVRSLWLVPPLYYARRASRRARLFQELATEIASCAAASFDPSFYSFHPHLDGTMFFI